MLILLALAARLKSCPDASCAFSAASKARTIFAPRITSVQLVQIVSLPFADGTISKLDAPGFCRVAPDMFMRIAGR